MRDPQSMVVIREDDAVLPASEIRACLLYALTMAARDISVLEVERKKFLILMRCLQTEKDMP